MKRLLENDRNNYDYLTFLTANTISSLLFTLLTLAYCLSSRTTSAI